MRAWIGLWLAVAACGGDKSGGDTSTHGGDTGSGPTDTGGGNGGGTTSTTPQSLSGTLTDAGGAGLAVTIKLCNLAGCQTHQSDASGVFSFENVLLDPYSFEPVVPEGLAVTYLPLQWAADEVKTLNVTVPALDAPVTLGPRTEVELGDGLYVTVGKDDLEPPAFVDPATTAAGVRAATVPPIEELTGTPLAVWYTAPFDFSAPSGLPYRIENTFGLADGETAHVYVGSYDDYGWLDAGEVTAGGGFLSGSGALPKLSTVLLIQP